MFVFKTFFWVLVFFHNIFLIKSEDYNNTFIYTEDKLQTLMKEAKYLNPFLEDLLISISNMFNSIEKTVKPIMGPLKTRERTISKMLDEKGFNLLEIHDLSRGSLIFLNQDDMYLAIDKIREIPYINITKVNDKFKKDNFYKDINLNLVFLNSTVFYSDQNKTFHLILEIQFHLCHLYHAKLIDDPVYHVRRLTIDDNSPCYPNTFQKEVDKLLSHPFFQTSLYKNEFSIWKKKYFSFLSCIQVGENYCDSYWDYLMKVLNDISSDLYSKAWNNIAQKKKCHLDSFPPQNLDLLLDYL